ncbi:regulatory protein RecX [Croceibacterium salegens]|uniref:regulatory protein RecX n=1 Tax=Croceibacterium salegens TaxID=1737568 RepID=UPI001F3AEFD9|nr:RecX family transcriptional regulator [Croceibacterium salegens]
MALSYVARFSTSAAKFERYLVRKLRERGWDGEGDPPVAATVERYVELGYIDDEAYARMKSGSLLRRGYGGRRVRQALGEAGIAEDLRERAMPGERAAREAAMAYATRRRFGPFGLEAPDPDRRQKQIAAMVRAGHGFDAARALIDAPSAAEAEQWLAEAGDEEDN